MSPTARSLALLRKMGFRAEVVERRVPHAHVTRDLFGCIDIVAVRPGEVLGVQATTAAHRAARLAKAVRAPALADWLAAGGRFEVWAWKKTRPRQGRAGWVLTRVPLGPRDLPRPESGGGGEEE